MSTTPTQKGYSVSFSRVDTVLVVAHVANGKGQNYTVHITENGGCCTCESYKRTGTPDKPCKHVPIVRAALKGKTLNPAPAPDLSLAKTRIGFGFAA